MMSFVWWDGGKHYLCTFSPRPDYLRICTIIVSHSNPTQFALTWPSDGHNQCAALWCPGIRHQPRPIPPITLINTANEDQ